MDFDQLLRKYLTGTLSEAELERFRDLLERRPEYKVELRQTLELRSLIQDDALNIMPPDDLSDGVRIAVGARFAAENPVRKHREEERRRGVIFPFRIAAGAVATTFIALMVILGPTIIEPFGESDPSYGTGSGVVASNDLFNGLPDKSASVVPDVDRSTRNSNPDLSLPTTIMTGDQPVGRAAGERPSSKKQPARASGRDIGVASLNSGTAHARSADESPDVVQSAQQSVVLRQQDTSQTPDIKALALVRLASEALAATNYNPALDTLPRRGVEALAMARTGNSTELEGNGPRMMTIGMTLGSGRVAASDDATTPLLQNSYYFSFSVSSNDRIGLEMGSSTFRQEKSLPSFGTGGFTKGNAGSPTQVNSASAGDGSRESTNPVSHGEIRMIEQRLAQQITYGAVFYDRRVEVARSWDLCGRMTVGAADNALIGNLRAYAAFSPSKNVTLTLGVGGSGLYNLNSKGEGGSGNYGIYYGIETGF
jgi:hypothetical protein